MKKIFFSLLAIAALASCAKTEPVYTEMDSEIKLAPVTTHVTKANVLAAIDGTEYPTAENFDVYAYWSTADAGTVFTDGTLYLGGPENAAKAVEFTNKGAYWGGVTSYYWPKNGSLRFAAYSPSSIDMAHKLDGDVYSVKGYVQPSETAATWDFLVAPTSVSYNAMTAAENVAVEFQHGLSWITLQVEAKDAVAAKAFDVKKVTINDVVTTADLEATMNNEAAKTVWNWNLSDTKADYVVFSGSQAVTENATVIETTTAGTLVIPQSTTKVTVEYTQNALEGTPALENQSVTVDLVLDTDNTPWEPGKHYIYTLIFGLDEILINPSVALWDDVAVGEIDTDKTVSNVSTEAQLTAALTKGGKVVLQNDITVTTTLNVNNTVVLDLNGKTLTNNVSNTSHDVIIVGPDGKLTINGEGTVAAVTGNDGYAVISEGLLIINGGTYTAGVDEKGDANAVIYARGNGEVVVNGGNFPNDSNSGFVLNKKDADRASTSIEVAGGKFKNFNPGDNAAEGANTNFLKAGFKAFADADGWYTVFPIVVTNAEQFIAQFGVSDEVKIGADIDLSDVEWTPVGTASDPFTGVLDGQGHKITGLNATGEYAALIAYAAEGTVVKDLNLVDVYINSTKYGAAVVCVAENNTIIENVTVSGKVSASAYAAGLVLMNNDDSDVVTVRNCTNNASIDSQRAGGIAAWVTGGSLIEGCVNNGNITGGISACGITNRIGGTIKNCVNNGSIVGSGNEASAGIAGTQTAVSTYEYCYNYGEVTTKADNPNASAAGILGQTPSKAATLNYCVNCGAITAEQSYAAGIAYSLYGNITASYCYNSGAINGADGAGAIAPKAQYGANDTAEFCLNAGAVASSNGKVYQGSNKNKSCYYYSVLGELLKVTDNTFVAMQEALGVLNGGSDADFFSEDNGKIVVK